MYNLRIAAFIATLLTSLCTVLAQEPLPMPAGEEGTTQPLYKYRIRLRDKKGTPFSVKYPEAFLSPKAIERRRRQGLKIDRTDLPLSPLYVEAIRRTGVTICHGSKWNNTLLVATTDTTLLDTIRRMSCVVSAERVAVYTTVPPADTIDRCTLIGQEEPLRVNPTTKTVNRLFDRLARADSTDAWADSLMLAKAVLAKALAEPPTPQSAGALPDTLTPYGAAIGQISQLGGLALHEAGYSGQGMTIAVVDGGFYNADIIPALRHARILGTHDFVDPGGNVYEAASHGMMVLSCIAANDSGRFIGTAPEAAFYLLRSEDTQSEQTVEEDNWAAAVEWADSAGVDIINSSLGYTRLSDLPASLLYRQLDGRTHLASRSASLLAAKGIVLCNSAGNSGDEPWKMIGSPADARDILAVGAVDAQGINTAFSSVGPTADGRLKPDVMAPGNKSTVLSVRGNTTTANGTSFAAPTLCGLVACFWQANPTLTALQVIEAVRNMGDNATRPDNIYGWGIPDFSKGNPARP